MKKFVFLGIFISLLFISSCTPSSWDNREYYFSEGFADLAKLDAKHNTSFYTERLNSSMIALDNIEPFIADVEEFRENVRKTRDGPDKEALVNFATVRITMALSQKNFQLAQKIGDIGLTSDESGFSCGEFEYIYEASNLYNKSLVYAQKARSDLDTILYEYRKIPHVQELVGLDENKTKFYYFHLGNIKNILKSNERALTEICKIRVVKN